MLLIIVLVVCMCQDTEKKGGFPYSLNVEPGVAVNNRSNDGSVDMIFDTRLSLDRKKKDNEKKVDSRLPSQIYADLAFDADFNSKAWVGVKTKTKHQYGVAEGVIQADSDGLIASAIHKFNIA